MYKFIKEETFRDRVTSKIEVTLGEHEDIEEVMDKFKNFLIAAGFFWIKSVTYETDGKQEGDDLKENSCGVGGYGEM